MGSSCIHGIYTATDCFEGMKQLQAEADIEYGRQQGYSGAVNSCSFKYKRDLQKMTKSKLEHLVELRWPLIASGEGEIYELGTCGYYIISTVISKIDAASLTFNPIEYIQKVKSQKEVNAVLFEEVCLGCLNAIYNGTLEEMKVLAHRGLRQSKYTKKYFIITKTGLVYKCVDATAKVKTTKRVSDDKVLVLPVYEWFYIGCARS